MRSVRCPVVRPSKWPRLASRPSTCPGGRLPLTGTSPSPSIPTSRSIRQTRLRPLCAASTTPCRRADEIEWSEGASHSDWFIPIVADAESGFGGPLNVFELTKAIIEAGAAAVHLEDQLSSEKKCGHMGGKVLVPTSQHVRTLASARLAADVMGVPTADRRQDGLAGSEPAHYRCRRA